MRNTLLLLTIGFLVIWLFRFIMGLVRGRVKGAHPIEKKVAWIKRTDHPKHFWFFTLLQCLLLIIFIWVVLGLRSTPAY